MAKVQAPAASKAFEEFLSTKAPCVPRIGVFSVAHATYFSQFPSLREKLDEFYRQFLGQLSGQPAEIVDYGLADSAIKGDAIARRMRSDSLDLVFCNMITYATSSVFAPIARALDIPIVLVALQPRDGMDYTNASTRMQLENDNICAVPEFTYTANRMGHKVADVIIGTLEGDREAQDKIAEWCAIARVLHAFKGARIGLMGHVMEAMYDMHTDPTAVASAFGVHVPLLEVDDMLLLAESVTDEEVEAKLRIIREVFDFPDPESDPVTTKVTDKDLLCSARTAVVMDKLIEREHLTGLAYYYEGIPGAAHQNMVSSFIVGNSLLLAKGVPICGEYDVKTCLAMLLMDRLGIGGSFAEFHPFDFREDFILVGHDGPHHIAIAEGRPVLRSLKKYHGKPGSGASVEFKIKEGPITMLGITQNYDGSFKMVIGEGISKQGPIPPTGNTNTRGFFLPNTKEFVKAWVMECPTHHYALGVGHHAKTIETIGKLMGIETVIVKA